MGTLNPTHSLTHSDRQWPIRCHNTSGSLSVCISDVSLNDSSFSALSVLCSCILRSYVSAPLWNLQLGFDLLATHGTLHVFRLADWVNDEQRRRRMFRPGYAGYWVARNHDGAGCGESSARWGRGEFFWKKITISCILSGWSQIPNIYCGCRQRETVQ